MDEATNKIEQHIREERRQLEHNIYEIESRVKNATDLKGYFDRHTGLVMISAAAGGYLLSKALDRPTHSHAAEQPVANYSAPRPRSRYLDQLSNTVDSIFEGLAAMGSAKLRSIVDDVIPGFQEHYDSARNQRQTSPTPARRFESYRDNVPGGRDI